MSFTVKSSLVFGDILWQKIVFLKLRKKLKCLLLLLCNGNIFHTFISYLDISLKNANWRMQLSQVEYEASVFRDTRGLMIFVALIWDTHTEEYPCARVHMYVLPMCMCICMCIHIYVCVYMFTVLMEQIFKATNTLIFPILVLFYFILNLFLFWLTM